MKCIISTSIIPFLILELFSSFESFLWLLEGFGSGPVHFSCPRGLWAHPWVCCPCSQVLGDTSWNSWAALQILVQFLNLAVKVQTQRKGVGEAEVEAERSRSVLCHCLHSVWIISSCSQLCLIQEGFCLTNAHYCVRLWLQPAKGHSVWLESFAKNCTWEHAVPSGCYENSSSTKCRTLPKKILAYNSLGAHMYIQICRTLHRSDWKILTEMFQSLTKKQVNKQSWNLSFPKGSTASCDLQNEHKESLHWTEFSFDFGSQFVFLWHTECNFSASVRFRLMNITQAVVWVTFHI